MRTNKHICISTSLICISVLLISHVAECWRAFTELFFADENVALKYLVECIHMKLIHNAAFSRPYLLLKVFVITSTEMYYSASKSQIISHMYIFIEW